METIRYFTKANLIKANQIAIKRNYNRAVTEGFLENLPSHNLYPIVTSLVHSHKGGRPTEPHMRVVVVVNEMGERVVIDCDWSLFNRLPISPM